MTTLRIGTWNCFGIPQKFTDFLDGTPFWPERFASNQLCAELSSLDILCVQENMVRMTLTFLRHLRKEAGFDSLDFDSRKWDVPNVKGLGSGLALLTKGKVTKAHVPPVTDFGNSCGIDKHATKGFQLADLELAGGERLVLVNTHLQANDPNRDEAADVRDFQRADIRDAISNSQGAPVLVCGDFNIDVGSEEHRYWEADWVYSRGLTDLARRRTLPTLDPARNDLLRCREPHSQTARVDYLWGSHHVRVREIRLLLDQALTDVARLGSPCGDNVPAFASDHFGLVAEIEVRP